jgi:hypothetical protein
MPPAKAYIVLFPHELQLGVVEKINLPPCVIDQIHVQCIKVYSHGVNMNCLRSLERWDRGFEPKSRHGYMCGRLLCVCVFLCVGCGLATG